MSIVPVEVHDQINGIKYLLEAIWMMATGIGDHDQVRAVQRVVEIAKKEMLEVEEMLEALDKSKRMTGGQRNV